MKPLKIGFVLDDTLDKPDGVQQYIRQLGRWLTGRGHEVHYIVGDSPEAAASNVHGLAKYITLSFNHNQVRLLRPLSYKKARALLKAQNFDVLHVQLPCNPWFAGHLIRVAAPNTAIVGTFHVAPYSRAVYLAGKLLYLAERRMLRQIGEVVSVSPVARSFARRAFHLPSSVIPIGIDVKVRQTAGGKRRQDGLNVLFLGRLVERKGCQYLLGALAKLQTAGEIVPYKLRVAGTGPLAEPLKRMAADYGLDNRVEFLGYVSEAEKAALLRQADVAVFPSSGGESFGIVLVEAMAAVPGVVLAGNNAGYSYVMDHRRDQLFRPQQIDDLADKLRFYLSSHDARQAAHVWQQQRAASFSIETIGPQIEALYLRALSVRRDVR